MELYQKFALPFQYVKISSSFTLDIRLHTA